MNLMPQFFRFTERHLLAFQVIALALVLLGTKVIFIAQYGSPVPFWDQWDAEADLLYRQYSTSTLSFATLFSSHNEHRIVLTRLLSLGLLEINGEWDPILQMLVNGLLHIVSVIIIVLFVAPLLTTGYRILLIAFSTLVFVIPFAWDNLLAGFQSEFYLLLLFSLLAFFCISKSKAFDRLWWAGLACLIASYFSMASGALTAVTAVVVVVIQIKIKVRRGIAELVAAAILAVTSAIMMAYIHNVPEHDVLKAHGITSFLDALLSYISYPFSTFWASPLFILPCLCFSLIVLVKKPRRASPLWRIFATIVWLSLQAASLSLGRAAAMGAPRYIDIILFALPLIFGTLVLFESYALRHGWSRVCAVILPFWLLIVGSGLMYNAIHSTFPDVVEKGRQGMEQQENIKKYLLNNNYSVLEGKPGLEISYPSSKRLAELLSDKEVRLVLPEAVRPADISESDVFAKTILKGHLHRGVQLIKVALLNHGRAIVICGVLLWILSMCSLILGQSKISTDVRA